MTHNRFHLRWLTLLVAVAGLFAGLITFAGPAQAATSNALYYQFQWQENGYYCGPAAVRIALTSRNLYYTQNDLAGQLGTTTDGTSSAADTTRVLNGLGQTGWYETKYIGGNYATDAQKALLRSDILLDIDRGYPLVTNIVGTAVDTDGDAHSYSGGHYITVIGYDAGGGIAKIADPADANGAGWYSMDTNLLADWIAGRGYSA